MRVLGLVPARGGSKGVPRKNLHTVCGKPLLQYTAQAALAARLLSDVVLSTDDTEIAELGRRCGMTVPFMRPPELARDETPMLPVIQHAMRWMEDHGQFFDAVCLLQPTNPLRQPKDIDACIELLDANDADTVMTILPVPLEYNPHWVYFQNQNGALQLSTGEINPIARRQELQPAFHREGSVYVTRRDIVLNGNSLYGPRLLGYPMDARRSVNIDTPHDLERAIAMLSGEQNLEVKN